jgi:hypothetical protein
MLALSSPLPSWLGRCRSRAEIGARVITLRRKPSISIARPSIACCVSTTCDGRTIRGGRSVPSRQAVVLPRYGSRILRADYRAADHETTEESSLVSNLAMSRDGVPTFPPKEIRRWFHTTAQAGLTPQRLEYIVSYHDGIAQVEGSAIR